MTIRNTSARWGHVAQFLHWLIVALIIAVVTIGQNKIFGFGKAGE